MNFKSSSFFLAVILSAATPALADKIPEDRHFEEKVLSFSWQSIEGDEVGFRFNSDDMRKSELAELVDSRSAGGKIPADWLAFGPHNVYAFGEDHYRGEHNDKRLERGERHASVVPVPEPSSQLLLALGLASVGMIFFRRHAVTRRGPFIHLP
jgi:hypothetical protein